MAAQSNALLVQALEYACAVLVVDLHRRNEAGRRWGRAEADVAGRGWGSIGAAFTGVCRARAAVPRERAMATVPRRAREVSRGGQGRGKRRRRIV